MLKYLTVVLVLSSAFIAINAQASDYCLQCTSTIANPACNDPEAASLVATVCVQPSGGECFSRILDGGHIERGCAGRLDATTRAACDSETCSLCARMGETNSTCNDLVFPVHRTRCHICSGGPESTCAGRITTTQTVCPIFQANDRCYIARPNGNYERGCLSSATARCQNGEGCHVCEGMGCNFEDFNSGMSVFSAAKLVPFIVMSVALAVFNN